MSENDYPSEETLEKIRKWDGEPADLIQLIASEWHWPDGVGEVRPGLWTFATGGWSGNESLLDALYNSAPWYILHWQSIRIPGGLLCIAITKEAEKEMDELHDYITKWAWRKRG